MFCLGLCIETYTCFFFMCFHSSTDNVFTARIRSVPSIGNKYMLLLFARIKNEVGISPFDIPAVISPLAEMLSGGYIIENKWIHGPLHIGAPQHNNTWRNDWAQTTLTFLKGVCLWSDEAMSFFKVWHVVMTSRPGPDATCCLRASARIMTDDSIIRA